MGQQRRAKRTEQDLRIDLPERDGRSVVCPRSSALNSGGHRSFIQGCVVQWLGPASSCLTTGRDCHEAPHDAWAHTGLRVDDIRTRDGRTARIDATTAKSKFDLARPWVGHALMARGMIAGDGTMKAALIVHAKDSPKMWLADR